MARKSITAEIMYAVSEPYFKALKQVLKHHDVFEKDYAIGKLSEESTCIINDGTKWEVFFYEKGEKRDSKSFERIDKACIRIIELLGDPLEKRTMKHEFQLLIGKTIPITTKKVQAVLNRNQKTIAVG